MDIWHDFPGPNVAYILDLYEQYRRDPGSVDATTRAYFARWPEAAGDGRGAAAAAAASAPAAPAAPAEISARDLERAVSAANLARAIRAYGHLAAQLDPLGAPPPGDPALNLAAHGLTEDDLRRLPAGLVGGPTAEGAANALAAVDRLRSVYASTIGYDYDHIHDPAERAWLREAAESRRFRPPASAEAGRALLERLTEVEVFERFLHRVFPGKTRFSIEGVDMLVPMLDEIVAASAGAGTRTIFIGMAHRGRLNVLAHILNKPYAQILAEFKDPVAGHNFAVREELGWTGDVKYHKGASRSLDGTGPGATAGAPAPASLTICMPPNPSHLEHVDPVIEGMARAAGTDVDAPGAPHFDPAASLPIMIHGDASFTGQGIVAETLNLSQLEGYSTGGTLHIITNNQLGFTAEPNQGRSTLYASDLAKGFNIPVVHVNADDPPACLEVAALAHAYRVRFQKDFLIDLIGYRRYGHNEGDEPSFTQPLMYQNIEQHPTVATLWANRLVRAGMVPAETPAELARQRMDSFQGVLDVLAPEEQVVEPQIEPPPPGTARRTHTALPAERLRALNLKLLEMPPGFTPNPKLVRAMQRRRAATDDPHAAALDWGAAEELALATILEDGVAIRLTGQDAERGTFNQRHAVFHDYKTGAAFVPLQALPTARAAFQVCNSPLSENAALGFEYGFNIQAPERLVLWEAQYGDFINGAQAIVDEFVVSGRAKWEQTPSLVLLLPHAYEGQGPDHSSGRLERFLSLAADLNIRITYPTTAAQYFHLLRRQAALLCTDPLPLVVMTPKSLLRHPSAAASLAELAEGGWQPVIDDAEARDRAAAVRRLVLCSGKVYVDLTSSPHRQDAPAVAIARVEQLYPFPADELRAALANYPQLEMVTWVQEEPENMGAWPYIRPYLQDLLAGRWPLHHISRPLSSSPAEGSAALHAVNQQALVELAYNLEANLAQQEAVWLRKA